MKPYGLRSRAWTFAADDSTMVPDKLSRARELAAYAPEVRVHDYRDEAPVPFVGGAVLASEWWLYKGDAEIGEGDQACPYATVDEWCGCGGTRLRVGHVEPMRVTVGELVSAI